MSIKIPLSALSDEQKDWLAEVLTVQAVVEKRGQQVFGATFCVYKIEQPYILLPLTFGKAFVKKNQIKAISNEHELVLDLAEKPITLKEEQVPIYQKCIENLEKHHSVVLAAYPGFGKTIVTSKMLTYLYSNFELGRTLVLTHRTNITKQWIKTFKFTTFSELSIVGGPDIKSFARKQAIGFIPSKDNIGQIIVSNVSSKQKIPKDIQETVDVLVIDEAHRFYTDIRVQAMLVNVQPKFIIFNTATPNKTNGLHSVGKMFAGPHNIIIKCTKEFTVYCIKTPFQPECKKKMAFGGPTKGKMTLDWHAYCESLFYDLHERNEYLSQLIALNSVDRKILSLFAQVKHVEIIKEQLLDADIDVSSFFGNDTSYTDAQVLLGTVGKIGEGFDEVALCQEEIYQRINLMIYAVSYQEPALIEQIMGRVLRADNPIIFYIHDNSNTAKAHWNAFRSVVADNFINGKIVHAKTSGIPKLHKSGFYI